jgi:hypothetical protein
MDIEQWTDIITGNYQWSVLSALMRASTLVIAFGIVLFALPIPGTFIAGALVVLAGALARWLGS